MDDQALCPACNLSTSRDFNFCENCEVQLNCLNPNCAKSLKPGKSICLYCGTAVAQPIEPNRGNSFSRFVEQNGDNFKEEIKIDMTNHAVSELAPFIAGQIVPRSSNGQGNTLRGNGRGELPIKALGSQPGFPEAIATDFGESDEVPVTPTVANNGGGEHPESASTDTTDYKVFEKDGEKLVAIEKDFKASNRKGQLERFIVLFTYEYMRIFNKPVPDTKVYQQATAQASLYNPKSHATYFKAISKEFLTLLSEGYKLNNDGDKEFKKIIGEMQDEGKAGFAYWEKSSSPSAKTPVRFGKEDKVKVDEWATSEVDLGKLKIGDLTKALDTLLIGIWILTVQLQKEKAVRWVDAYNYMKSKFTTIKATGNAVSIVLGKPVSANYIMKTPGDLLYLNSDGISLVEKWISGGLGSEKD